jgi:hypothetical protein
MQVYPVGIDLFFCVCGHEGASPDRHAVGRGGSIDKRERQPENAFGLGVVQPSLANKATGGSRR